ncbi:MAG TPA: biotin/lipoyl-binding protein [Bryobacteraceae bacterium]|jgi:HlyD family secretion protein|nr:biotin/lipoyl-binding protein [Bryobacteraceae bacterium]
MRGKWVIVGSAAVLAVLIAVAVAVVPRGRSAKATSSETATSPAAAAAEINLSGKIRAQHVIGVAPPLEGTISAFLVDVGQQVFEGQLLARLTNEGLEAGQQNAKRDLEITQSRVSNLESAIISGRLEASRARADASRARSEYDRLDRAYRRQQTLFNEGATPKQTFEKSTREFQQAQSEFDTLDRVAAAAEAQVSELIKSLDAEKRTLREKTESMETATAQSGATELVSPAEGIVVGRNGEVGQTVGPNKADFIQIATQPSLLEVILEPDPPTMRRIQPGQPALVSLPDQGADGMLGKVKGSDGNQVLVEFTSPNPAIKPGMIAQVRIKIN